MAPSDDDITPVFDLLDRDLLDTEREVVRRSRRDGDDPATYADVVKLAKVLARERRARRETAQDPRIGVRVAQLELSVGTHRKLIWWAAAAAAASFVAVGTFIYTRGFSDGADKVRIEHLERTVDDMRTRELNRHSDIMQSFPAFPLQPVITKDKTP